MATRLKTIEYVFPTAVTTLATATRRDHSAITLYIPEASGTITFRSVEVEVTAADDITVAASMTAQLIGIKLGAVAFNDVTVTDTITNSGEAQSYRFTRDATSYFTANWTGTSMTCQVGVQYTGLSTQNHCAKLKITYEYDDTQSTHIKTIRIPIESTRSKLTTSMQTVGGSTAIPALTGSYLPEGSVTVRQIWVELWGNEATSSTGDFIAQYRINGGSTVQWWDSESALSSPRWAYGIGDITAEDLSSARSIECSVTTTTTRMETVGGMVCVTYEFDPGNTTTVFNSLMLGAYDGVGQVGGTTSTEQDVWSREIFIQEPDTITLKESGVCMFGMDNASTTIHVGVGSQSMQSFTVSTSTQAMDGQWSFVHRIDSGGAAGSDGMTLARGSNTYTFKAYSATANHGWQMAGFIILNYTSSLSTLGIGAHAQSRYHHIGSAAADDPVRYFTATSPTIPESNYWLVGAFVYSAINMDNATAQFVGVSAEKGSGEGEGDGWEVLYAGSSIPDNENNNQTIYGAARSAWKRWPNDPDADRMDIEISRRFKLDLAITGWCGGLGVWFTYHSIYYTIQGTLSGWTGDGSGYKVRVWRTGTTTSFDLIEEVDTTTDGAWSCVWYDNVDHIIATASYPWPDRGVAFPGWELIE